MFLLGAYLPSKQGELCHDRGLSPVSDKDECARALESLQDRFSISNDNMYEISYHDHPKWCFVWRVGSTYYSEWNTHKTGAPETESWQICKSYGKLRMDSLYRNVYL